MPLGKQYFIIKVNVYYFYSDLLMMGLGVGGGHSKIYIIGLLDYINI